MKSLLEYIGISKGPGGYKVTNYRYKKKHNVVVSKDEFSTEDMGKVPSDKLVIHVSFYDPEKSGLTDDDISYCLRKFGIDTGRHYYSVEQQSMLFGPGVKLVYYEQIVDRSEVKKYVSA